MKKIKIYESEIKRAVRRKLMENVLSENHEMRDTYSKSKYRQSPREEEIEGVFGQYGEEIPPSVLRYMRKNPQKIIKRLFEVYGQQMFDYISKHLSTPDMELEVEDEEVVVDEGVIQAKDAAQALELEKGLPKDSDTTITVKEEEDWIQSAIKKPGSLSKELGVPEEDNIPSSLINKEIDKLKEKDKDPKKKGIQGLSKRNLNKFRKLNLAKTLKNL